MSLLWWYLEWIFFGRKALRDFHRSTRDAAISFVKLRDALDATKRAEQERKA